MTEPDDEAVEVVARAIVGEDWFSVFFPSPDLSTNEIAHRIRQADDARERARAAIAALDEWRAKRAGEKT